MTFIKIGTVVINTQYIAAVKLDNQTASGEESISILLATPNSPLLHSEAGNPSFYPYEWLNFIGQEAVCLRDYFSNFSVVVDLSF
ncbi:MAG: hypothetical protein JO235_19725 [Chroococcidiopsidaceae cyanobacterium CP_BM_RX_35]|nr:hypothetical protein [Chroococcidiopsidaceae cyanobacterium CP_BM_RX_35]